MYQVVELYGYFEPWWFLEDWQDDIIAVKQFEDFDAALLYFRCRWSHLRINNPYYRSKASLLTAFWDGRRQSFCEDCDEELQEYHSLALLKDWEEVPESYHQEVYERRNDPDTPLPSCKIKKIG